MKDVLKIMMVKNEMFPQQVLAEFIPIASSSPLRSASFSDFESSLDVGLSTKPPALDCVPNPDISKCDFLEDEQKFKLLVAKNYSSRSINAKILSGELLSDTEHCYFVRGSVAVFLEVLGNR